MATQFATLGGGCFWCIEAAFNTVKGVIKATSGYTGGEPETADYKTVCSGTTGHVEVVQIEFDPELISYEQLLVMFFKLHDPTQLNKQGNDLGTQYRGAIFYHNDEQQLQAKAMIDLLKEQQVFEQEIVTAVEPLTEFYPAEDYHQGYFLENPDQAYCAMVVSPKYEKFRALFSEQLKS
ncbi:peptide-methionine (S)-S-oxide reductase MsrA [Catenovulum sp. SM1970]|uniref:peptide-methionine (S)-S-oxide reductase MsrA n=1 Tax=Marinifaba aquimaris TaxID=2741323 RepID=UPI001572B4CA|nr:peptide-methionine (S)-S-oxide reductase MsrA [Marinifaba aquimaris]NTS76134.1 peptide-methionine (S)-S-oxide reductase MsrA [Marinifaba aquimaris]